MASDFSYTHCRDEKRTESENRDYSAAEVVQKVSVLVDAVKHHRRDDPLRYSASDICWLLRNMFRYIGGKMDRGEFILKRLKKGVWRPEYHRKSADEQKADRRHQARIAETRKLIDRRKF